MNPALTSTFSTCQFYQHFSCLSETLKDETLTSVWGGMVIVFVRRLISRVAYPVYYAVASHSPLQARLRNTYSGRILWQTCILIPRKQQRYEAPAAETSGGGQFARRWQLVWKDEDLSCAAVDYL